MLPGKSYSIEMLLRIAYKRMWWVLVPFAMVSAVTVVGARQLPDVYRSDALILINPQRVPDSYVTNVNTTRIQDRIQANRQSILSRGELASIVEQFDLQNGRLLDEAIADVRRRIEAVPVRGDAFRLSFTSRDPRTAQAVTSRLTTLFIDWSNNERQLNAQRTAGFFEDLLESTRLRLAEQEQAKADFVNRYYGELPGQLQSNMQALSSTEMQIQNTLDSIQRDEERRDSLRQQLLDLQNLAILPDPVPPPAAPNAPTTAAAALANARAALAALRTRGLKPDHPDIQILERQIRDLEVKAEAEAQSVPLSSAAVALPPAEAARLKQIQTLQTDIAALERQIGSKRAEEERLRSLVGEYRRRIDVTPTRDTQMIELNRNYDTLEEQYRSLLRRKENADIAEQVEEEQIGESFRVLDEASLPQTPISPNRRAIYLAGMGVGLALGLGLLVLLEYRDRSFHSDDEITSLTGLPVLAVVPLMMSDADRRREARVRWLARIGFGGTVAACLAVVVMAFV